MIHPGLRKRQREAKVVDGEQRSKEQASEQAGDSRR